MNCYEQDDATLVSMIRPMILPPSTEEYNLTTSLKQHLESRKNYEFDLSLEMEELYFANKTQGFFIEAGAAEGEKLLSNFFGHPVCLGETDSHTLFFEAKYNWTGLLDEPSVNGIMYKHRKSHVALTCLATETRPHFVHFEPQSTKQLDDNHGSMAGTVIVYR